MILEFLPEASAELYAAAEYYEQKEEGLGWRFRNEVLQVCQSIVQQPVLWRERSGGYRRVKMRFASSIAAVLLLLTGCNKDNPTGFANARLRHAVDKDGVVELRKFTAFEWDRVYVFAPYASPEHIKAEVGKEVAFPHSLTEGHCLLVFVTGRQDVRSFEVGRGEAYFAGLHRTNGYTPQEAIFIVEKAKDGWKKLQKR